MNDKSIKSCPIMCVLAHVDAGKTALVDALRKSHIQKDEAGGITQQIGATFLGKDTLNSMVKELKLELDIDGILVIDTPGHECFSQMRIIGASVSHLVILVVDIVKGLEKETINCVDFMMRNQIPFVVVLSKLDKIYGWKSTEHKSLKSAFTEQKKATMDLLDDYSRKISAQFAEQGVNAIVYYKNKNKREFVSMVPLSSKTGEGLADLVMLVSKLSGKRLEEVRSDRQLYQYEFGHIIETKKHDNLGQLYNVILANGVFRKGDLVQVQTNENEFLPATIQEIYLPQDQKEMKNKNVFQVTESVSATRGCGIKFKLDGWPSDHVQIGGLVVKNADASGFEGMILVKGDKHELADVGVTINAPTVGMADALHKSLQEMKIPVHNIHIGPINKKIIIRTTTNLKKGSDEYMYGQKYAVILQYSEEESSKEIMDMVAQTDIKVIRSNIIYQLIAKYNEYVESVHQSIRLKYPRIASRLFCRKVVEPSAQLLPKFIFMKSTPLLFGVKVMEGKFCVGDSVAVKNAQMKLDVGEIVGIQSNNKDVKETTKGQEVCVKISNPEGYEYVKTSNMKNNFDSLWILVRSYSREDEILMEKFRQLSK